VLFRSIGRDKETRMMVEILGRRTKPNVIIVGEPGVGKTALVEGLAQLIVAEQVPGHLQKASLGRGFIAFHIQAEVKSPTRTQHREGTATQRCSRKTVRRHRPMKDLIPGRGRKPGLPGREPVNHVPAPRPVAAQAVREQPRHRAWSVFGGMVDGGHEIVALRVEPGERPGPTGKIRYGRARLRRWQCRAKSAAAARASRKP